MVRTARLPGARSRLGASCFRCFSLQLRLYREKPSIHPGAERNRRRDRARWFAQGNLWLREIGLEDFAPSPTHRPRRLQRSRRMRANDYACEKLHVVSRPKTPMANFGSGRARKRTPPESTSRSAEVAREKQRTSTSPANALYFCVDLGVFGFYIDISGHRRSGRDGSIDPPAAHSRG